MMFGLGVWEIFAIVLVIAVFVRPSELPRVARKAGDLFGRMQAMARRASAELRRLGSELDSAAATSPDEADIHPMQVAPGLADGATPGVYSEGDEPHAEADGRRERPKER